MAKRVFYGARDAFPIPLYIISDVGTDEEAEFREQAMKYAEEATKSFGTMAEGWKKYLSMVEKTTVIKVYEEVLKPDDDISAQSPISTSVVEATYDRSTETWISWICNAICDCILPCLRVARSGINLSDIEVSACALNT